MNDLLDVAEVLIMKHDADPMDQDYGMGGYTPLHYAAYLGHANFIRLLVKEGRVDPEAIDENGQTPFHVAARANNLAFIRELLKVAPHVDLKRPDTFKQNAMYLAAYDGGLELMEFLAENDVPSSLQDADDDLPLHRAASGGHSACVKFLVNDSNVNQQGWNGTTPLYNAVKSGSVGCVAILLERGANPNITTKDEQAALTTALFLRHFSIASLLLDKDADPLLNCDVFGGSPLLAAATVWNRDTCDRLLRKGCNGLQQGRHGWTAFARAVQSGDEALVESFITHGQNGCHLRNDTGGSVFHLASKTGNISMFQETGAGCKRRWYRY